MAFSKLLSPPWKVVLSEDVKKEAGDRSAPGYVGS